MVGPQAGADAAVEQQLELLRHRGPDAAGSFGDAAARIAQNRLAIIDLDTGDPPIGNEDGTLGVVLNGEIYNFGELRQELTERGHRLRSRGDTEVIVHLAEELTPVELARRLQGMFAFAVWDSARRRLVLGRDRVGKKPLYYWHGGGRLVFGSEIKAVLAGPGVPRQPNPRAIDAYLTFGYVPTPETFFAGVRSVPPGHVLVFEPGGEPKLERYWSVAVPESNGGAAGLAEAAVRVRGALESAVRRRLISDVPLGAFLSGGIDSSAIVGLMASMSDRPVRTFTIGFDDSGGFDERDYARAVARRFGTDHHEEVVAPDAVELVETLLWHHDQPFGDSSAIPTYLLNQVTRQGVTVALSGDGGDELFGGYERFAAAALLGRYRRVPRAVRSALRLAVAQLPPDAAGRRVESAQRFTAQAELGTLDAYRSWLSFLDENERREALPGADDWALRDYEGIWAQSQGAGLIDRLLHLNVSTYLVDDLLVKADRMSMAHALEVRSPFLDTDLLELAFALPAAHKVRGFARKRVLVEALGDLLPAEILKRRKRGFGVPLDRWFREDLERYLRGTLGAPDSRVRGHLASGLVDRLLAEHASGRRNHGQALWMLLTLELFLRREGW